jgi:hypothetical protein
MEESSKSKKNRRARGNKISNFSLNKRWSLEKNKLTWKDYNFILGGILPPTSIKPYTGG